jgi:hypothetical protein
MAEVVVPWATSMVATEAKASEAGRRERRREAMGSPKKKFNEMG